MAEKESLAEKLLGLAEKREVWLKSSWAWLKKRSLAEKQLGLVEKESLAEKLLGLAEKREVWLKSSWVWLKKGNFS